MADWIGVDMADATCPCGKPAVVRRKTCNPCYNKSRPKAPCSQCGKPTGHTLAKAPANPNCMDCYQSRRAAQRKPCIVDGCDRLAQAKGTCLPHRTAVWRRENAAKGIERKRYPNLAKAKTCAHCRKTFKTTTSVTKHCQDCSRKQRWKSTRSHELEIYTGPAFVREGKNKNPIGERKGTLKSGQCKACSSWFITFNVDVTCSDKCQKWWKKNSPGAKEAQRVSRDRRRARKKDAFVENVYRKKIYARDGHRCQLRLLGCKGIDMNKVVPHPKAPTIDHIIPLASGGTHEPKNCHAACFYCNWTKSDRGGGEQLLLIG